MNEKKLSKVFAYVMLIIALITIFSIDVKADLTDGLLSYYKFDNNLFTDSIGISNGFNDGTINAIGIIGDGRNSTGTGGFINISDGSRFNDVKSWSFWINPNSIDDSKYMLADDGWGIRTETDGSHGCTAGNKMAFVAIGVTTACLDNTIIEANHYQHFVIVFYDPENRLVAYKNGNLVNNASFTSTLNTGNQNAVFLGHIAGHSITNAAIDEVGLWNRTLNFTEVQELYNSGEGFSYPFEVVEVNITSFENYNRTNETLRYKWDFTGDFLRQELYLDSILKLNTTNSSIKGFNATNLMPDTEYFAELYVYANATVYDYANITNTTLANAPEELTTPDALVIVGNNISDLAGSIRLIMLITIFVLALYLPNYARDKFRYETFQGVKTMSLVLLILILGLLFYVDLGLPAGFRNLLALATAVFIFGNAVFGEEDSYENSLSRH